MATASRTPQLTTPSGRARPLQLLAALGLGVAAGLLLRRLGPHAISAAHTVGQLGQLWLNALRMTLIPLVFCLMTVGVARIAQTASGGRVVRIAISVFLGLLLVGSIIGAIAALGLMALWPVAQMHATAPSASTAPPSLLASFIGFVPSNPIASAAEGAVAPLIVFAAFLGVAIARIKSEWSTLLLNVFNGLAAAMLLIIECVLRVAPAGIFFLLLDTIASVGSNAAKGLLQYGVLASLVPAVGLIVAESIGLTSGVGAINFARAALAPQTLAATTLSSSACLPPLLEAGAELRLQPEVVSAIIPLAVATFRLGNVVAGVSTGLIGAALFGIHPSVGQIVAAVGIGVLTNVGSVGVPGAAVVFAAWAPIYLTLGVPLEALTLYIAVITVPDIFITTTNVTGDLAATSLISTLLRKRTQPALEAV